jgi:hypothetical protein
MEWAVSQNTRGACRASRQVKGDAMFLGRHWRGLVVSEGGELENAVASVS